MLKVTSARKWEEKKRLRCYKLEEESKHLTRHFKGIIINDQFLNLPHEEKQLTIPWLDEKINLLRKQVFVESINYTKLLSQLQKNLSEII